jgi:hypothetical protein
VLPDRRAPIFRREKISPGGYVLKGRSHENETRVGLPGLRTSGGSGGRKCFGAAAAYIARYGDQCDEGCFEGSISANVVGPAVRVPLVLTGE